MTDGPKAFAALATASSAMLGEHHVADVLARLLSDCLSPLRAGSAAILVTDERGSLALLSASSHRVADLEMLQAQQEQGPCVDTIDTGEQVTATGDAELRRASDVVGPAIRDAGYQAVHAFPMRWHGRVLGGLNVFRTEPEPESTEDRALGQAFADMATLVLLQAADVPADQVSPRIREAISARSAIEQAKGVLAHVHRVNLERAFDLLERRRQEEGTDSLVDTARRVVHEQHA